MVNMRYNKNGGDSQNRKYSLCESVSRFVRCMVSELINMIRYVVDVPKTTEDMFDANEGDPWMRYKFAVSRSVAMIYSAI